MKFTYWTGVKWIFSCWVEILNCRIGSQLSVPQRRLQYMVGPWTANRQGRGRLLFSTDESEQLLPPGLWRKILEQKTVQRGALDTGCDPSQLWNEKTSCEGVNGDMKVCILKVEGHKPIPRIWWWNYSGESYHPEFLCFMKAFRTLKYNFGLRSFLNQPLHYLE